MKLIKGDRMKTKELDFLFKVNDLQKTKRYGNYPLFSESTAEHTFKLILIVDYFYKELNLDLDYQKCISLSIYHDFGEMDLEKDVDIKENTVKKINIRKDNYEIEKIKELSNTYYGPIVRYYEEYKEKMTEEARFVNACDKLEGMIHPLTINAPIMNHEIFATYADKAIEGFPKLLPVYKEIKELLKTQYEKWGFEWKSDYDSIFKHCNNK